MKTYKTSQAVRDAVARWQAKNPGYAKRRYSGEHQQEVDRRLAAQGGACAVCKTDTPGMRRKSWHLDHDHSTGLNRGVLCAQCNIGIGFLKDDPSRLRAAADYLERHARLEALL